MSESYRVEPAAYVKLQLHAAKHPASAVCGLLLGEEAAGGAGFVVADAVPLFHHASPLAPLLETACAVVDAWSQAQRQRVVGFYYAGEGDGSSPAGALAHFAEKAADKVEANCSRACVLLVDPQQLQSATKSGVQLLLKDVKRGWVRVDNRLRVDESGVQVLATALQQNAFEDLVDFDEHVEDVSKDWRNPHLLKLLKLNV